MVPHKCVGSVENLNNLWSSYYALFHLVGGGLGCLGFALVIGGELPHLMRKSRCKRLARKLSQSFGGHQLTLCSRI